MEHSCLAPFPSPPAQVSRELVYLQGQQCTSVELPLLQELAGMLLAYGRGTDRALALKFMQLAGLDLGTLAASIVVDKLQLVQPCGQGAEHVAEAGALRQAR